MSPKSQREIPMLYQGSVKDVLGPVDAGKHGPFVIFNYSDAYSVFDWGRMPDLLPGKGEALALIAGSLFEELEQPESWKEFSRSPEALSLRKGNRWGSAFNEVGERLQSEGLRTHYFGLLSTPEQSLKPQVTGQLAAPVRMMMVKQVSVVPPVPASVLGKSVYDYTQTRLSPAPRLVPLEVVFRFSLPPGSSLLERMKLLGLDFKPGHEWEFPYLELFTKLESSDRLVSIPEALSISGISAPRLEEILFLTAWVGGWLKSKFKRAGLELADGKLEWGVASDGAPMLVDAIGPDELRLLAGGVQVSKEFLRTHYRKSEWYGEVLSAKSAAEKRGDPDWKKGMAHKPEPLPADLLKIATGIYPALANALVPPSQGKVWFKSAPALAELIESMKAVSLAQEGVKS